MTLQLLPQTSVQTFLLRTLLFFSLWHPLLPRCPRCAGLSKRCLQSVCTPSQTAAERKPVGLAEGLGPLEAGGTLKAPARCLADLRVQ